LILPIFGIQHHDHERAHKAKEDLKKVVEILENHLKGKTFLVGNHLTIADIAVATSLFLPFRYLWEESARKGFPNVTRYFENIATNQHFQNVYGKLWLCQKTFHALSHHGEEHKEGHHHKEHKGGE